MIWRKARMVDAFRRVSRPNRTAIFTSDTRRPSRLTSVSQSNMAANVTSASTIQIRRRKIRNTSRASRTTSNGWGSSGIMCTMRAITSRNFGTLPSGSSCRDVPMWTSRALKSSHNKRVQRRSPAPTVLSETVLQKRASSCSAS